MSLECILKVKFTLYSFNCRNNDSRDIRCRKGWCYKCGDWEQNDWIKHKLNKKKE